MTEAKGQTTGGETETGATPAADDALSPLGTLPEGITDETPLESFDEESFLESITEDDQRPRFGAEAGEGAIGLAIGDETDEAAGEDMAPQEMAAEEIAALDDSATEMADVAMLEQAAETDLAVLEQPAETDLAMLEEPAADMAEALPAEEPVAEAEEGLDLGLDELDLAAIEEVADDSAMAEMAEPESDRGREEPEAPKLPKFMFDVSFDLPESDRHHKAAEPEPEPTPEPEPEVPPPPTFSEEELAAARQAGFADGQAEGYQQAMQSLEAKMAQGIDAVGLFLPDLLSNRDRLGLALANDAARLAHALVRRALPELNRRYGPLEIEAVVSQAIQTAIDQPRIHIRVAPEIAERLTAPVENAAATAGFAGRVTVVGDPALAPADVRLEWGDGGVERLAEQVWTNLTAIVARLVEGLETDTGLKSVAVDSAA